MRRWRSVVVAIAALAAITVPAVHTSVGVARVRSFATPVWRTVRGRSAVVPDTTSCLRDLGIRCYAPAQLTNAYDVGVLHAFGIDGRGRSIVLVDSFGSPTIRNDLHVFDQTFGLPDPPTFKIIQPVGSVPPFDATNFDMVGWAMETTLDVEWSHAMAPRANIVLVETPVSETEGVQGFPEIVQAENFVIDHGLGDVISQSFGATEQTFPNARSILQLRSAFQNARRHHVTVLASSGDSGATDYSSATQNDRYPMRVTSWPASDPLVTSVGGTKLTLDAQGRRLAPDVVWNDSPIGATGGGLSTVFPRPWFQDRVRRVVDGRRGVPDVSLSASHTGAVIDYTSFAPFGPGYGLISGTSEAAPLFSGIVAMADQLAGRRLGWLNPKLYRLRQQFIDVTQGNNSFGPFANSDGTTHTVVGFAAAPGYDLASGLGTIDGARLVVALAHHARDDD
jgi:subtilase family serine protease